MDKLDKIASGFAHLRRVYGKSLVPVVLEQDFKPGFIINTGEEQEVTLIPESGQDGIVFTLGRNEVLPIRFRQVVAATDETTIYFIY